MSKLPINREMSWYDKVAQHMTKQSKSMFQACVDLNIMITSAEADAHFHTDAFQQILRTARAKGFGELANDPGHNKRTLVGKLLLAAERLFEEAKYDKAAEVIHKIAKIEGWDSGQAIITVIGDLTQKDIDLVKQKLKDSLPQKSSFDS